MFPPYSKFLVQALAEKNPPTNDVYLFIGKHAWEKAKNSSIMRPMRTLCLPPDRSPYDYQWPVAMCDVLIFDTGETDEELVEDLAFILFEYQAVIVRYVNKDGFLTVFKRNLCDER